MDESYKVAITRLGDRIRVGGTAEISGFDLRLTRRAARTLDHSSAISFRMAATSASSFWCGLAADDARRAADHRAGRECNLCLNTGHGTLGWTMACGSGKGAGRPGLRQGARDRRVGAGSSRYAEGGSFSQEKLAIGPASVDMSIQHSRFQQ